MPVITFDHAFDIITGAAMKKPSNVVPFKPKAAYEYTQPVGYGGFKAGDRVTHKKDGWKGVLEAFDWLIGINGEWKPPVYVSVRKTIAGGQEILVAVKLSELTKLHEGTARGL